VTEPEILTNIKKLATKTYINESQKMSEKRKEAGEKATENQKKLRYGATDKILERGKERKRKREREQARAPRENERARERKRETKRKRERERERERER